MCVDYSRFRLLCYGTGSFTLRGTEGSQLNFRIVPGPRNVSVDEQCQGGTLYLYSIYYQNRHDYPEDGSVMSLRNGTSLPYTSLDGIINQDTTI